MPKRQEKSNFPQPTSLKPKKRVHLPVTEGLSQRAGGQGTSLPSKSLSPGYFETKPDSETNKPLKSEKYIVLSPSYFFTLDLQN